MPTVDLMLKVFLVVDSGAWGSGAGVMPDTWLSSRESWISLFHCSTVPLPAARALSRSRRHGDGGGAATVESITLVNA
eukprot:612404-Prorocentrum_minimum.AAC.1